MSLALARAIVWSGAGRGFHGEGERERGRERERRGGPHLQMGLGFGLLWGLGCEGFLWSKQAPLVWLLIAHPSCEDPVDVLAR